MANEILPIEEHIRVLLDGEMHQHPCDDIPDTQLSLHVPPWFDKDKFVRGQKYLQHNMLGQSAAMFSGLMCVLSVPSILKILINTQKSSTVESAYRRYLSTTLHVYSWYFVDLQPGTTGWESLLTVRKRHLRASKSSLSKGGTHISQRDLILTQFGFYGLGLLRPRWLGMDTSDPEDVEGYVHFWRTIGYMIGIQDRYNACRPSVEETKQITQVICVEVYQKLLYNPPEHFYHMMKDLVDGMWYIDSSISTKSFFYFTYWLVGVKGFTGTNGVTFNELPTEKNKTEYFTNGLLPNQEVTEENILNPDKFYSTFSWLEKFKLYLAGVIYQKWMFTYIGRLYYNWTVVVTIFLAQYLPYTAFWKFGLKRAYVNMFQDDIAIPGEVKTNKEVLAELYS